MRRRFFVEQFEDGRAILRGPSAEHLARVLRAQPGQIYELSDGARVFLARIESVSSARSRRAEQEISFHLLEETAAREPLPRIELLLAIVKFDRFEWALEKAAELGVAALVPLRTARTDRPLLAAAAKRVLRWRKIALEAAQQSRQLRPPEIRESSTAEDAFQAASAGCKIMLSERPGSAGLRVVLAQEVGDRQVESVALAIGPEGGWTGAELDAARAAGFREASLGENILRTETAVIAAVAIVRFGRVGLAPGW